MSQDQALNQILDDLEDAGEIADSDALYRAFGQWAKDTGRELYPHQVNAITAILMDEHVIAATPTGSGKSLIAAAAHLYALAKGGRSYYTAPLKALVSEKFFDLVDLFGAANVGMITGDVSLNEDAPIICCTAEILANQSLREGDSLDAYNVVMDEFHYYGDRERGAAWQIPLLELTHCQFILMSATLGDVSFFVDYLQKRTNRSVQVVDDAVRPVPLEYEYTAQDAPALVERLVQQSKWPLYLVHFSQKDALTQAKALSSVKLVDRQHREDIKAALAGFNFSTGFGKTLSGLLKAGIGVHHAGMLPRYRRLVEKLAGQGLLVVICGTDTLGVGINVPIRTVALTGLAKFDGKRQRRLSAREFHQIAGRAGRAGFDHVGYVVAQAPPHEIENAKNALRKDKKKKSAPPNFVGWSEKTFETLIQTSPEPLTSRFEITHAMVLSVLERPGGSEHLVWLAQNNHDVIGPKAKAGEPNSHLRRLGQIYQSLKTAKVLQVEGEKVRITATLPEDFALNAQLSPFALAALDLLDPTDPNYSLDVISVIESVLEDPKPLLWAQQDQARARVAQQLKDQGIDYFDRKLEVAEVTWPKPLQELLEDAFRTYRQSNPWLEGHSISPKTVVRYLVENAMTFTELISHFNLERSEGVVLRYLSDAYRALRQVIPPSKNTEAITQITQWLGDLVRSIDSSLLDEWEALARGTRDTKPPQVLPEVAAFGADDSGQVKFSANKYAFRLAIRKEIFHRVELLATENAAALAGLGDVGWSTARWEEVLDDYFAQHHQILTDNEARSNKYVTINERPGPADFPEGSDESILDAAEAGQVWLVTQTLVDEDADLDWKLVALVDVAKSDETNQAELTTLSCRPFDFFN